MTRKRLTVTVFRPDDYVRALADAKEDVSLRVSSPREIGRIYAKYGPAYTIWIEGKLAACMGVMIPWDGFGDGWAVWTPLGLRHPGLVHRVAQPGLQRIITDYKLRRLQADVIADFAAGRRWAAHMGLTFEGSMPSYGPKGETFARYAWINPVPVPPLEPARFITLEDGRRMATISGGYDGGATIIIALTVLAAAASAYATYSASQAQESAYKANAAESERQAEMADQQARFAAQQQVEKDRRLRATARAIGGTSGVDIGEGSSLLADLDSAKQAELNYQSIRYQGESQVRALTAQATLDRFQGRQARQQGMIGAGASLLGGLSSAAGSMPTRTTATPKTITVPSGYGTGGFD